MDTTRTTAPRSERPRWWRGSRGEPSVALLWLTTVAPVALSLLSLALSLYAIFEANREPEIWLSAPVAVKLSMKPAYDFAWDTGERARFYVQPRLVSSAANNRVGVIADLRLEVTAPGGAAPLPFTWIEQGTWLYDPDDGTSSYSYLADPAPLVVGPSSPQLPICQFQGPPGWHWQPGTYQVTIVATPGQDAEPLRTVFTMTLSQEQVDYITAPGFLFYIKIDTQLATPPQFR